MSIFQLYLNLGLTHITDLKGYDHILFLFVLSSFFLLKDWKKILILVTGFTIGHSITLILSSLSLINFDSNIIELLIPVTILITSIFQLSNNYKENSPKLNTPKIWIYGAAIFFGLIHGLGFSFYLKYLLSEEESPIIPLISFNLGIELGQIIIVIIILVLNNIINKYIISIRMWSIISLIVSGIIAVYLITQRLGFFFL